MDNLKKGVSLCFRKSYAFTTNARLLFNNSSDPDIVSALLVCAIEELGKGLILRDFCEKGETSIPSGLFGKGTGGTTHRNKIQRGMDELQEKSLIHPKLFEILSHKDTQFNDDRSITYIGKTLSREELSEMF